MVLPEVRESGYLTRAGESVRASCKGWPVALSFVRRAWPVEASRHAQGEVRAEIMTCLREIWTELDANDPVSFPPLDKPVLLAEKGGQYRGWYHFRSTKQRDYVCRTYSYTHWRGELMVDFP